MRLSLTIILLVTMNHIGSAQASNLRLVSDIWPPFTNVEPHRSFAEELVTESLKRTGVAASTDFVEFEEVVAGIKEGKYHGSAALWYSEDREKFLMFSAPYLQNQLILVGRKGSDVSLTSFAELAGKKVAVVGNYAYGSEVDEANEVIILPGKNDQQNLERLLNQEVDYMLVDALLMQYLITHQQEEVAKYLEIGSKYLFKRALHFAIKKDLPGAKQIIERFNQAIIKMVADGSYNRILQVNWIRADVDGDGKMEMIASGERAGKSAPTSSYDVWFQSPASAPVNNRYYIDGRIYQGWDNVPQEYKVQPVDEKQEDFKLLKFGF